MPNAVRGCRLPAWQTRRNVMMAWCCTRILNIKCEASLYIAYTEEVGAGGRTEWVYTKSFCLWWGWAHAAGRRGRCAFYLLVALLKHADAHTEHAILDARSFPHVSYICSCVANMQSIYGLWMNKGCTQKHKQQRARLCISKRPTNKEGSEFGCLNIWRVSKLNCGLNEIEIVAARVLVKSLKCCQHHPQLLLPNVRSNVPEIRARQPSAFFETLYRIEIRAIFVWSSLDGRVCDRGSFCECIYLYIYTHVAKGCAWSMTDGGNINI